MLSLAVEGDRLVNGADQTTILRGLNISGTEWECLHGRTFRGPADDAGVAAIAAWQVNAVRIPLNEDCWLGINGVAEAATAYRADIAAYVARLHEHGLYAILDLHWSAPGTEQADSAADMADADHSPDFWRSVASYFREDPAVVFDLFNEPRGIDWACWRNGCDEPGFETAGMQALLWAVRESGATQPVLAGGIDWASRAGGAWLANRPQDPARQLVAAVHIYDQDNLAHFESNIGVVAARVPVVVGEVGETDCGHRDLDVILPWADAHGVSYAAWAWYVGDCAKYPSLISDYSGTPTSFGSGYRDHLLASATAAGDRYERRLRPKRRTGHRGELPAPPGLSPRSPRTPSRR